MVVDGYIAVDDLDSIPRQSDTTFNKNVVVPVKNQDVAGMHSLVMGSIYDHPVSVK